MAEAHLLDIKLEPSSVRELICSLLVLKKKIIKITKVTEIASFYAGSINHF